MSYVDWEMFAIKIFFLYDEHKMHVKINILIHAIAGTIELNDNYFKTNIFVIQKCSDLQ